MKNSGKRKASHHFPNFSLAFCGNFTCSKTFPQLFYTTFRNLIFNRVSPILKKSFATQNKWIRRKYYNGRSGKKEQCERNESDRTKSL